VWGNATFCGQDLAICQDIWTLPWFLPLERFVLRCVAFFDNPYAGVAANRWNVWLGSGCDVLDLKDLASAEKLQPKLKLKYFGSQVSLTPA